MDVGRALADARTAAGFTVEDVADRTKLRSAIVRAMEANDYAASGPSFARMYVRTIAQVLDVDPEPLLAQMQAADTSTESFFEAQYRDVAQATRPRDWRAFAPQALALSALLLLVIVAANVFMTRDRASSGFPAPSTSPSQRGTPTASASPTPSATASATPSATASASDTASVAPTPVPTRTYFITSADGQAADEISLTVSAQATTWVRVRSATTVLWTGVLEAGSSASFSASTKITVSTRDAGALALTVNGEEFSGLGDAGQSLNLTFRFQ